MSVWTDFLGADIRHMQTLGFSRIRITEAGRGNRDSLPLLLMHGIGGYIEAYAKNVLELGRALHVASMRRSRSALGYAGQLIRYKWRGRVLAAIQSEAPGEFNTVMKHFLLVGRVADSVDVRP